MTPQAPAGRNALRLVAASLALLALAAPAAFLHAAQRGPAAEPPPQRRQEPRQQDPGAPVAPTSPAARPAPEARPAPAGADDAPAAELRPSDILPGRPDLEPGEAGDLLGDLFESKGHGIALRPPRDSAPIRRTGAADFIEFVNKDKGWTLKITKSKFVDAVPLTRWRDPAGNLQPGLLEHTATRLKEEIPDAEFLRQEKIVIGARDVGMLVLRHTRNAQPLLSQQAIIQESEKLYYFVAMTTPGGDTGAKNAVSASAGERLAVETFGQVLDSVKLLDLQDLRAEQDVRLDSTRYVLLKLLSRERTRAALVKKQWTRVLRKGKDVGYSTVEERVELKGGQEGVEIAIRSRMLPSASLQVDAGSILFASMDLRHEDWSTLTNFADVKQRAAQKDYKPPQIAEFGSSDRRAVRGRGRSDDDYSLQVIFESTQEKVKPVARPLPPFYLPQAYAHLLPRLLPLDEPKGFLFAAWVPESREVILRYVDVKDSRRVEFNGGLVRCVPVEERIGLEGSVTTHYMSHDGQWLGSETKDSGITVLPTTEAALLKLWKDAILTRPEAPAREGSGAGPAAARDDNGNGGESGDGGDAAAPGAVRDGRPANTSRTGTARTGPNDAGDADARRATPRVGERRRTGAEGQRR